MTGLHCILQQHDETKRTIYTNFGFCISWTTGMELTGWKIITTDYGKYGTEMHDTASDSNSCQSDRTGEEDRRTWSQMDNFFSSQNFLIT
jgi:hypothetical protein